MKFECFHKWLIYKIFSGKVRIFSKMRFQEEEAAEATHGPEDVVINQLLAQKVQAVGDFQGISPPSQNAHHISHAIPMHGKGPNF